MTGTLPSNWVNSANSSDHHVPVSSDDAEINVSGITVEHTASNDSVHSLTVSSSQTTLIVYNGTLSIAADSTISGNVAVRGGTLASAGDLGPLKAR